MSGVRPRTVQGWEQEGTLKSGMVLSYHFPLQRYFMDPKEAKLMQWHAEREKPEEDPEMGYMLTHPSDMGSIGHCLP
jgi:hypothetical protein